MSVLSRWLAVGACVIAGALACSAESGTEQLPNASAARRSLERTRPALRAGTALSFEPAGAGRVRPILRPSAAVRDAALVELPERLGTSARITAANDRMALEVTLQGASPALGEFRDGHWMHPGGAPGGGDVWWRATEAGAEDHVTFPTRPSAESLSYRIALRGVSGLRHVGETLELLDASGTPRLRMGRPWVFDRHGRGHLAQTTLRGCVADTDPRPPWGRPVVAPGSRSCTVTIDWSAARVAYPIVVDPPWTSTGTMAEAREHHGAARLNDGRVLVTGGWLSGLTAGAEIYDPTTNTFASTAPMSVARAQHGFVLLSDGRVLASGGWGLSSAEAWNPATGTWSAVGSMAVNRGSAHVALELASGKVLMAGGASSTVTELFDPTTNTFSPTGNLKEIRYYDSAGTLLNDGRVFIVGGGTSGVYSLTGEIYDPATGVWTLTAPMKFGRSEHKAILLTDGRVLVPGGVEDDAIKYSDIYDPATNKWTPTPNLKKARRFYSAGRLSDGRVLVTGGEILSYPYYTETAEIYDPIANTYTYTSSMSEARYAASFTFLNDGGALVAGGYSDDVGYLKTAEVFRLLADGAACSLDTDCISRNCVDGVCCATKCTGLCQACSAALKTSGPSGVCGPAKAGTAESACAGSPSAPCGFTGACNGQGGCAFAAAGAGCSPPQCASGQLSNFACNGLGACTQTSTDCAPYVCGTQTSCATSCASDAQCASSAWCDAGTCKPDLNTGAACSSPAQCKSGHCADGFCCDSACDAPCMACSTAKKGSGANGTCQPVGVGSDPDDDCPDDGAASCQRDGACDGSGACRKYAAGVSCASPACAGNAPATFACDGKGVCTATTGSDCGSYLCSGAQCTTSCSTDSDCAPTSRCASGACVPLGKIADTCTNAADCVSGFCVDGRCCNAACDGQCEACDVTGGEGYCVPVAGAPHGSRPACPAGDPQNPCSEAACDGVERTSCKDFVGSSVVCGAPSCSAGVATAASTCDGSGKCPAPKVRDCAPYLCSGDVCALSCTADTECKSPARCDAATGKCVVPSQCVDDDTVQAPNGTQTECAPFRCADGACLTTCASVKDCVAPYICGTSGVCQTAKPPDSAGDSSGCSVSRGPRPSGALLLWFAALAVGAWRRRRRSESRRAK